MVETPAEEARVNLLAQNSRFIASLSHAGSVEEAKGYIHKIKNEFPDASHHVAAYLIGGGNSVIEYCTDAGEPSGTAGKPALTVLRASSLGDVVLVITRYFGGTLLGKGGLVKAYTESAQLAVAKVKRARKQVVSVIQMVIPYNKLEPIRNRVKAVKGNIISEEFSESVEMKVQVGVDESQAFQLYVRDLTSGKCNPKVERTLEILLPVID